MKLARRKVLQLAGSAATAAIFSQVSTAQTYPARPITMIVPFAAGGSSDVIGRAVAEGMRKVLRQPIVIENVGGADGTIGVGRAARARSDGYTINLGTMDTHVLNGGFYSLPYDLLNDLVAISPLVTAPVVLFARRTMQAKDLNELIAWLQTNSDKASAGVVTFGLRLMTMFFQRQSKTRFAIVPYRGGAARMQDLVAGQIDLSFGLPDYLPMVRAGSIKAYAVASDTRMALAPDVPTFQELGLPSISFSDWFGIFAPKGTPLDIIGALNRAVVEALGDPRVRSRFADLGYEVFPREQQTREALVEMQNADVEKWWPIIKEYGIRAE